MSQNLITACTPLFLYLGPQDALSACPGAAAYGYAAVRGFLPCQVVVGNPPTPVMEEATMATPFGVVMAGKETARFPPALNEHEVKLAYSMGEWTAQVAKLLHDSDLPIEPGFAL